MKRVIVTRPVIGVYMMQVCAIKGATDKEILEVCNSENPAGTINGWGSIYRSQDKFHGEAFLPVQCSDYDDREHLIVMC